MLTLQHHQQAKRLPADSQQGSEAIKQLPTDATLGAGAEFATQTNVEGVELSSTNTALGAGTRVIATELTPMPTVVGTDVGPGTALTPTPAPTEAGCRGVMGINM